MSDFYGLAVQYDTTQVAQGTPEALIYSTMGLIQNVQRSRPGLPASFIESIYLVKDGDQAVAVGSTMLTNLGPLQGVTVATITPTRTG
jgi:hypothetical protein